MSLAWVSRFPRLGLPGEVSLVHTSKHPTLQFMLVLYMVSSKQLFLFQNVLISLKLVLFLWGLPSFFVREQPGQK